MGEVKDIRDELGILQIVLTDQRKTLEEFSRTMAAAKVNGSEVDTMSMRDEDSLATQNKVLESHLYRIEKMDRLAEKTYLSVRTINQYHPAFSSSDTVPAQPSP